MVTINPFLGRHFNQLIGAMVDGRWPDALKSGHKEDQ